MTAKNNFYSERPQVAISEQDYMHFSSHCWSATKMTGRPGHWSEPGEYNILFLGSMLVISSQDSPDLGIENSHKRVP